MKVKVLIVCAIVISIIAILVLFNNKQSKHIEENYNNDELKNNIQEEENQIFSEYLEKSEEYLKSLSLDEKIGQIFLVRYPEKNQIEILNEYKFGGYLFFERDFKGKNRDDIKNEIASLQEVSKIPLMMAVDEEGGNVVRASSNKKLIDERFKSPRELFEEGGFDRIREDTLSKSEFLYDMGINLNLAPVVDVSTDNNDYMYKRTLGEGTELTSTFAETVISASKSGKVSYTLKHFPGYGKNSDTHKGSSTDTKTYEDILKNDLPPFIAGIKAGAEAVLVSHNIVTSIDESNPASLSSKVHEILRNELKFSGIIITDDLYMGAVSKDEEAVVKAVLAGNDLIIVTDYKKSIEDVKVAIEKEKISEETIDNMVRRIIAWKYYKGMIS